MAAKMNKKLLSCCVKTGLIVSLVPLSGQVYSQVTRGVLEEVTVTAQRREQNLQDVGVSATAFSNTRIRDLGISDATDIGSFSPGVQFITTSGGSTFGALSIRGVAQSDFSTNQESPNAIYIDDIYNASNAAAAFATYDMERIEVLRGPQGTLFGRNSAGGLAHFITAKPTDSLEGYAELGGGEYGQYWLEGAISGPISDRVRGRLAGKWEQADGYWGNKAPGGDDTFETDTRGARVHLEFDVTDTLLARFSASYDERPKANAGTYNGVNYYINDSGQPAPQPADLDAYGTGPGANFFGYRYSYGRGPKGEFDNVGFYENDNLLSTLMLEWSLEDVTVTSLSNYTDFNYAYLEECDGSPVDYCRGAAIQDLKQWSQEIRLTGDLGPLVWTAGVYYLDIDADASQDFLFPLFSDSDFAFDLSNIYAQKTTSWATFGQIEWQFSDAFRLIAGLRYTYDEKKFDSKVFFNELGNGYEGGTGSTIFQPPLLVYDFSSATVGDIAEQDNDLWSGKVQLEYTASDRALLYAGISQGVKGAGFNTNIGGAITIEETPFTNESLLAYEVGGKFDLRDGSLRLNTALFYYDYSDYQGYAFNGLQGVVSNYDATMYGGEIEIEQQLPFDILVNLGLAYVDSEVEDVPNAYFGEMNQDTVLAAKWTANAMIQKIFTLDSSTIAVQWNFNFVDDYYASIENSAGTAVESSVVHNASVTWALADSGLSIRAFVNNLTDEDRQTFRYDLISSGGYVVDQYAKPRWAGISVRKSF